MVKTSTVNNTSCFKVTPSATHPHNVYTLQVTIVVNIFDTTNSSRMFIYSNASKKLRQSAYFIWFHAGSNGRSLTQ